MDFLINICKKKNLKKAVIDTAFELSNEQIEEIKTSLRIDLIKKLKLSKTLIQNF